MLSKDIWYFGVISSHRKVAKDLCLHKHGFAIGSLIPVCLFPLALPCFPVFVGDKKKKRKYGGAYCRKKFVLQMLSSLGPEASRGFHSLPPHPAFIWASSWLLWLPSTFTWPLLVPFARISFSLKGIMLNEQALIDSLHWCAELC